MAKRGDTDLSFMIAVDKPAGMTSHDVVDEVRRAYGERRVGHAGTLDPFATGILPIMVGPATRLSNYFGNCKKTYESVFLLGSATDTDDATGETIRTGTIKPEFYELSFARQTMKDYIGKHMQVPPQYSAVKVDGKKAYESAREGEEVELAPREVEVFWAQVVDVDHDAVGDCPYWLLKMTVSGGTYVRAVARDIGEQLGCCAHVSTLKRTVVGGMKFMNASNMFQVKSNKAKIIDPCKALEMYCYAADEADARAIENGGALSFEDWKAYKYDVDQMVPAGSEVVPGTNLLVANDDEVLAVYSLDEDGKTLRAETVFSIGVQRR